MLEPRYAVGIQFSVNAKAYGVASGSVAILFARDDKGKVSICDQKICCLGFGPKLELATAVGIIYSPAL